MKLSLDNGSTVSGDFVEATVGGFTLIMTLDQVERWNSGDLEESDDDTIVVLIPSTSRGLPITRQVSLGEVTAEGFYDEYLDGQVATLTPKA